MAAYLVARLDVSDAAGFAAYRDAVEPIVAAHGGRYLVRGGGMEVKEGSSPTRIVIVAFPTMVAAKGFYESDAYAPALAMRLAATQGDLVLVDGVDEPEPG